jgi:hypothetical protein
MLRRIVIAVSVFSATLFANAAHADDVEEPSSGGMQSPAMFGSGIVMSSAGAAGLITGAYLFTQGAGSCDGVSRDVLPSDAAVERCTAGVNQQIGGVFALATGGLLFLGSIPVIAVGASPSDDKQRSSAIRALIGVAPGGASLTVSF